MVQNLGTIKGPLILFGGPYSNLQATLAMKQIADSRGVSPQQVICTGDLVAYCADPQETVDMIREWGIHTVMGNCEESLGQGAEDCGCGFESGSACDLLSVAWYRYADSRLNSNSRRWMLNLPRRIEFEFAGRKIAVIHGGSEQINQFIFSSTEKAEKIRQIQLLSADVVIGGHCGLPFGQQLRQSAWLNSGVIGMPANDGSKDGWYLELAVQQGKMRCRWNRLEYDASAAQQRMYKQQLRNGYADALLTGLWPSTDICPLAEQQQTGKRLVIEDLVL